LDRCELRPVHALERDEVASRVHDGNIQLPVVFFGFGDRSKAAPIRAALSQSSAEREVGRAGMIATPCTNSRCKTLTSGEMK
jgi:hypothetical protein